MDALVLTARQRRIALSLAVLGTVVPIVLGTVHDFDQHGTVFLVGAFVGVVSPIGATLVPPRLRVLRWSFAYAGIVGLTMMQAYTGGVHSPYAILLVMAMIYLGTRASAAELTAGVLLTVACCYLPMLVFGPPAYPVSFLQATVLALVTTSVALSLGALTFETSRLTRRLVREASHDQLTGLLNRRGWEEATARSLARAARTGETTGLVLLDLDRLKEINDTLGHDRGDDVLSATGRRMRVAFRAEDPVARLGGDEFAVLVVGATADQSFATIERLRRATPDLGAFSAGIAIAGAGEPLEDVMRRADLALYEAKSRGRGRSWLAGAGIPPVDSDG